MTALWKPVKGYPGYEVNNLGRVRSLTRIRPHNRHSHTTMVWKGRILKPGQQVSGHLFVNINGCPYRVHRLVAEAFIGSAPFVGAMVLHRDGDPTNNEITNLYWGTQKDNMEDKARHGGEPRGRHRPNAKLYPRDIPAIRASKLSLTQLGDMYGVSPATIRDVRIGRSWTHV